MKHHLQPEGRSPFFFRDFWIALLAFLLALLAYGLFSYGLNRFLAYSKQQRRAAVMEKVSMARHALEPILADFRKGRSTREVAIEAARTRLRTLCFDDEFGPNYIFMNGMDGRVILRPFMPQEEGFLTFDFRDAKGRAIFHEVIPQLRAQPAGVFHTYHFFNPKTKLVEEKLSFFQVVPELDVMIGTGAYLNDATRAQLALLRSGFFLSLALVLMFLVPLALALGSLRVRNNRLAREVLERAKAEGSLRASEATLQLILDTVPLGVFWKGPSGTYQGCNVAFARTAGLEKPAQILGKSDFEMPWAERAETYQAEDRDVLASTKAMRHIRGSLRDAEGRDRMLDTTKVPLENGKGERIGVLGVFEDITERVRIQELMIQTEKMVSLGGLAAGMAHEINNPLGIISQAAQNLERRLAMDQPANRAAAQEIGLDLALLHTYFEKRQIPRFVGGIREAVTRAARIVSNMLMFSRQADATRQLTSLTELLEQALELAANDYDLKKHCDFRSLEIHREFDLELPSVLVVAIEIEQVLLNLLKNAIQAMAANPVGKPPCLLLRIFQESKYAVMEIEDNGPGMEESIRRRVFEPFFTTKEPGVGTGLGLSVSYTIITQNHKGLMEVVSTPGRGTRFTVRLPVVSSETVLEHFEPSRSEELLT